MAIKHMHPFSSAVLGMRLSHVIPPTNAHTQVLKRSQYLLLHTACPDALVRFECSSLAAKREELLRVYFQQHHGSLEEFLAHHLQRCGTREESLLMQVGWVFVSLVPSAEEKGKISAWCLLFVHTSNSHGNWHTTPQSISVSLLKGHTAGVCSS